MRKNFKYLLGVVTASFLIGCGGGSSGGNTIANSTTLTVVDPYIQDAVLYWDENDNGIYDDGEQTSTATSTYGSCTFSPALPDGAKVAMKSKGIHNGIAFDGSLTANISGTGIVSPMTTLLEKFNGDSAAVLTLLSNAGITLTEEDLTKDPMSGIDATSSTLDEDIKKIQASVAINTFLVSIGTNATKDDVNTASAILIKTVDIVKQAITSVNITTNDVNSTISSAVAVANYVTQRVQAGDTTILDTLSSNASGELDSLMTPLISNYKTNPEISFGLDATKEIADASSNISEVKSMIASQYFAFRGKSLNIEYSGGSDYSMSNDNDGSDDLYPAYMGYQNFALSGTALAYNGKWFDWDWSDEDSDNNRSEHVISEFTLKGTTYINNTFSGTFSSVETDGSEYSGTATINELIDGNLKITKSTFNDSSEGTIIEADKEIFISAQKVSTIAGVSVGDSTRDVYKVRSKTQYGQMSGDTFVTSGNGYNVDEGWDCTNYNGDISKYVEEKISEGYGLDSGGNSKVVFAADGKFINLDTKNVINDMYWKIENNILSVRAYSDWDLKIVDDQCLQNWIGDTTYTFTNITDTEANEILKVLVPDETLTVN